MAEFAIHCASRSARRRWIAAAMLVPQLVTSIGVPIQVGRNTAPHEQAYPCQHRACGCTSAGQCWRSCCCTTLRQRIAWAKANHVTPPKRQFLGRPDTTDDGRRGALAGFSSASDAARFANPMRNEQCGRPTKSCCSARDRQCKDEGGSRSGGPANLVRHPRRGTTLSIVTATKCRGLDSLWLVCNPLFPVKSAATQRRHPAPTGRVSTATIRWAHFSSPPPTPPPRTHPT